MNKRTAQEMVAYALEMDPQLLPFAPELLADLDELGSDAELITSVIGELGLPACATVVDLGCGKGAVAVEVAGELSFQVLGVDLFEPFLASCRQAAAERGVSELCRFVHGDILALAGRLEPMDVAVFAALGDVLGPLDETVKVLRKYVKSGGFIVVSDAFVVDGGSRAFRGFEQYGTHEETLARLTAAGDRLVCEVLEPGDDEDDDEAEDEESGLILARAQEIAQRHPAAAELLLSFARDQAAENDYIAGNLQGAIWVLARV